jgi:general secretion pathway protein D
MGGGYGGYGGYGGRTGGYGSGGYYPQQVATTPGQPGAVGSTTFQNRLQNVVSRMTGQQKEVQMLESAKIVPDRRSNSLIVYANKKDMEMITNMVAKVDVLLAQVLIEAIIMEVKLTGDFEFGVSAYFKDQSGNWGSEGVMNPGGVLNSLTNLVSGGNSFTYVGRYQDDMTMVVRALSSNGRGEILATPRIQTSHGMAASFSVGETVPYVSGTYSYGLGTTPSTTYTQLPVISELSVTPYITPDGLVVMDVTQTIQDISGFKKFDVGDLPITVERNAQAMISVQDQDTIILGGYIRNSRNRSKSGVPLLKDIPVLGAAFRNSSDNKSRTEMVVFLKPTVLNSPRDAALLATRERDRLPGLRRMDAEMGKEMDKLQDKVDRELGEKPKKQRKGADLTEP